MARLIIPLSFSLLYRFSLSLFPFHHLFSLLFHLFRLFLLVRLFPVLCLFLYHLFPFPFLLFRLFLLSFLLSSSFHRLPLHCYASSYS